MINKRDAILDEELEEKVQALSKYTGKPVLTMSAVNQDGLKTVLRSVLAIAKPKTDELW